MHIPAYLAKLLLPILWPHEDNLRNVKETAESIQSLRSSVCINVPVQLPLRTPCTDLPVAQDHISAQTRVISTSLSYAVGNPVSKPCLLLGIGLTLWLIPFMRSKSAACCWFLLCFLIYMCTTHHFWVI